MKRKDRSINLEEAIPGIIGTLLATLFLGFMAVDIGSIPLFLIVVLASAERGRNHRQHVPQKRLPAKLGGPLLQ